MRITLDLTIDPLSLTAHIPNKPPIQCDPQSSSSFEECWEDLGNQLATILGLPAENDQPDEDSTDAATRNPDTGNPDTGNPDTGSPGEPPPTSRGMEPGQIPTQQEMWANEADARMRRRVAVLDMG